MTYEKTCPNCEMYFICLQGYKELPPNEEGCEDWELALRIYQDMSESDAKKYIEECNAKK